MEEKTEYTKMYDAYMFTHDKRKQRIKIRNKIISVCKVSTDIFYNWLRGNTPVPHWAEPIIAEILDKEQSELFPEDEINV